MKRLILMNGICVWHEPFEFKYSSVMFYYIFRNKLIDNAVRGIRYTRKRLLSEFRREFFREIFTMRYRNAWLLLDGVTDFLRGVGWLLEQDGEELHRRVAERGYRMQSVDELSLPFSYPAYEQTLRYCEGRKRRLKRFLTLNGWLLPADRVAVVPVQDPHIAYFYRASAAVHYDIASKRAFETYRDAGESRRLLRAYRRMKGQVRRSYEAVCREYRERKDELTNLTFWKQYLGI